jgi:hypothetical protein
MPYAGMDKDGNGGISAEEFLALKLPPPPPGGKR